MFSQLQISNGHYKKQNNVIKSENKQIKKIGYLKMDSMINKNIYPHFLEYQYQ